MRLRIIPSDSTPVYKQLYDEIAGQVLSGTISPGEALPPIRTVAKELGISIITVRNAWDALIEARLIEARAGSGCFVAELSSEDRERLRRSSLDPLLTAAAETAKNLGFSEEEAVALLREKFC
ncbi:MAG: GntR family transcriptional regulator [Clostridiales bacterium]|nr:GntR family transcriptional regulator [Clostridiales bacterium]